MLILRKLARREHNAGIDKNPDQSYDKVSDAGDENRGNPDQNKVTRSHSLARKHAPEEPTVPDVEADG